MNDFRIEIRPHEDAEVTRLIAEVQQEYVARYGSPDAAAVAPGEFSAPSGLFLLGLSDGIGVATGGWRRRPELEDSQSGAVAEIKRMFVVRSARRRGLARLMLAAIEDTARQSGIHQLVLNTGTEQPEAVALYESSGYTPVAGYGHYAGTPRSLFYGKYLGEPEQKLG